MKIASTSPDQHDPERERARQELEAIWSGVQVGEYRIERVAHLGPVHVVFEAFGPKRLRRVAIKMPRRAEDAERSVRERVALEELADVALFPDYILHGRCEDGRPLLVMEWIQGSTLAHHLSSGRVFTQHDYFDLMAQLTWGLLAAHQRGFALQTLRAEHILLDLGRARLIDLSHVRHVREPRRPGLLKDARPADVRALASVLRHALTSPEGSSRFHGGEPVPQRLWSLIRRCERAERDDDLPRLGEIERALKQMLQASQLDPSTIAEEEEEGAQEKGERELDASASQESRVFARHATRIDQPDPRDSVEFLRQSYPGASSLGRDASRPKLDAASREKLRRRFARHLVSTPRERFDEQSEEN